MRRWVGEAACNGEDAITAQRGKCAFHSAGASVCRPVSAVSHPTDIDTIKAPLTLSGQRTHTQLASLIRPTRAMATLPTNETFVAQHVVPSSKSDRFNDGKCFVCWNPYNHSCPAVRTLPCNHVLCKPCLRIIVNRNASNPRCLRWPMREMSHAVVPAELADGAG
jgi:hypothetical protein